MESKCLQDATGADCACSAEKCDILDFMAQHMGMKVLHPGGFQATNRLLHAMRLEGEPSLLDIAGGKGTSSLYFAKKLGCDVTGIDMNEGLLSTAKKDARKRRIRNRIVFKTGNAEALPFEDNTFNAAVFQAALVLVDDMEKAVSEAFRVIQPGGTLGLLEICWLKEPTRELLEIAKKDVCAYCIARAKSVRDWSDLITRAGFTINHLSSYSMKSQRVGSGETIGTMMKAIFKMAGDPAIRNRIRKLNDFFRKAKGYLGYAIAVGIKPLWSADSMESA
jgi:arsenite methyltransferase